MANAMRISTTIRELTSRGRPPKFTSPVDAAHTQSVGALAESLPNPIFRYAAGKMRQHEIWSAS